ncbi:hypothetical protein TanjilG_14780 [Lupinus angustifolius]|uniref:Uncharacterized protein n=1 Tax=Lupinus angustifolius TaxID=3871 RepID=A0A1J7HI88_LUPAN|nr:hypothetical protein TanjilG_14780 [Lupinus angustifolius]
MLKPLKQINHVNECIISHSPTIYKSSMKAFEAATNVDPKKTVPKLLESIHDLYSTDFL